MIEKLLSPEVQKFIKDHQLDDPFLLSLNAIKDADFPLNEAIEQIQSYQKARKKIPSWAVVNHIIWPPPISIEQASSEITARFKSSLVHGKYLLDLTGGMGIDTFYFANSIQEVHYVEPDRHLCDVATHNFGMLAKGSIQIHHQKSEVFLYENKRHFDAIYIDPSRRSENKKVFRIEDCSPNLKEILPLCRKTSDQILIKLSPLVDLSYIIREFNQVDIWIVAVKNEVKEVLSLIRSNEKMAKIHAVDLNTDGNIHTEFSFFQQDESEAFSEFSAPLNYLYEPSAAILKAGAFKLIGKHFGIKKLHPNTHLYTSDRLIDNFPGKVFLIKSHVNFSKKEIQKFFPDKKVNVVTRNYPLSANQLKTKFRLKDGGDQFLLGITLMDGKKALILCKQLNQLLY